MLTTIYKNNAIFHSKILRLVHLQIYDHDRMIQNPEFIENNRSACSSLACYRNSERLGLWTDTTT